MQLLLAIAVANARNDPPPSADRTWSPPNLSNYESELAGQRFKNSEGASRVSINPRKVYNLAELIDIAERNNPETRVAWERTVVTGSRGRSEVGIVGAFAQPDRR